VWPKLACSLGNLFFGEHYSLLSFFFCVAPVSAVLWSDEIKKLMVVICQAELRNALIELGEVEHAMEDVMGLLQQVEADLQQFGEVYGDPRHIEVHLRKIQAR